MTSHVTCFPLISRFSSLVVKKVNITSPRLLKRQKPPKNITKIFPSATSKKEVLDYDSYNLQITKMKKTSLDHARAAKHKTNKHAVPNRNNRY